MGEDDLLHKFGSNSSQDVLSDFKEHFDVVATAPLGLQH